MRLLDRDGTPVDVLAQLRGGARLRHEAAEALFAGAPMSAAQVFEALAAGRALQSFELDGIAHLAGHAQLTPVHSPNVVGMLAGADPSRASEHVVFTAHLDHIGLAAADAGGDLVHNGAIDNALGVAVLLEAARELASDPRRPARPLLFVALTGEEQGLLGATHFAHAPLRAAAGGAHGDARLVANINLDMPVLLAASDEVLAIGAGHSSLLPLVEAAARDHGLRLGEDPFPAEVVFVRSDQYAFVRAGVPALL